MEVADADFAGLIQAAVIAHLTAETPAAVVADYAGLIQVEAIAHKMAATPEVVVIAPNSAAIFTHILP